ncbi:MAG: hypothetical protein QXL01_02165 [Thermoplasmatales archaeon]
MMYGVETYCTGFYIEEYSRVCESRILCCVVKLVDKIRERKMGVIMGVVKSYMQMVQKKITTQKLLVNVQKIIAWHNVIQRPEWHASIFKCCKSDNSCGGNNSYEGSNIVLGCCML